MAHDENKKIKCKYTDEIVCPYCGEVFTNSWDYDEDEDDFICDQCDREFYYTTNQKITYSTFKKK